MMHPSDRYHIKNPLKYMYLTKPISISSHLFYPAAFKKWDKKQEN